jgi:hypothetical protein
MTVALAQSADDPSADMAPAPARFEAGGDGTVLDRNTNLNWAGKSRVGDISWTEAQDYCQAMGAGWSLPSTDDLQSLYLPEGASQEVCMGKLACNITPLIEVNGLTFWSAESDAAGSWYVYFADGKKYPTDANNTQGKRALCVRRP